MNGELSASPFRLLCVEDDPSVLKALAWGFEAYSLAVVTASHGEEALEQFRSSTQKFDAVLTDHDMPIMNGLNLVKALRSLGFDGRILVMSGRLTESDTEAYRDYAISHFLQKPFSLGLAVALLR